MALKPCRECKKKVSTEAVTCPSCGVPNPTKKKPKATATHTQKKQRANKRTKNKITNSNNPKIQW